MTCGGTPENWVWTFSGGFLSHMNNTARDSLFRCVHNNDKSSSGFRWGMMLQREAGRNILVPLQGSRVLFTTHQHQCRPLSPKALLTSSSVSSLVWLPFFIQIFALFIFLFFYFYYFWSLFRKVINPPIRSQWILISCCVLISVPLDFLRTLDWGAGWWKYAETLETLSLTFAFKHTAPAEKLRRISGVQCMSESSVGPLDNSVREKMQWAWMFGRIEHIHSCFLGLNRWAVMK